MVQISETKIICYVPNFARGVLMSMGLFFLILGMAIGLPVRSTIPAWQDITCCLFGITLGVLFIYHSGDHRLEIDASSATYVQKKGFPMFERVTHGMLASDVQCLSVGGSQTIYSAGGTHEVYSVAVLWRKQRFKTYLGTSFTLQNLHGLTKMGVPVCSNVEHIKALLSGEAQQLLRTASEENLLRPS